MQITMDKRFKNRLRLSLTNRTAEVGILQNKKHYARARTFGTLEGRKVRMINTRKPDGSLNSVSKQLRRNTGINIFKEPFNKQSQDSKRFIKEFTRLVLKQGGMQGTATKLLQAMVRNPILRRRYGPNAPMIQRLKGFNWKFVQTGQLYRNIKARIRKK